MALDIYKSVAGVELLMKFQGPVPGLINLRATRPLSPKEAMEFLGVPGEGVAGSVRNCAGARRRDTRGCENAASEVAHMNILLKPRWPQLAFGLICVAALIVITASLFRAHEPVYQGYPLSHWVAEVANPNTNRQEVARDALRQIGPQAVPFLLRKARSENSPLKQICREGWFKLPEIAQRILRQPESKDDALSRIAHVLHQLGPPAGAALMATMEDKNADVRFVAGASFAYGHDSPMGVLWEIKLLKTADYDLKQHAASALGTLGSKARPAVPALVEVALHDGTDYVRETAARSLAMLGPEAASAAPGLKNCLNDSSVAVRLWSAIALWRINHDCSAIPVLISDLKRASGEDGTCHAAIHALGEAGALAKPAVPEIRRIMLQFNPKRVLPETGAELVQEAREALRLIDPEIDPVEMLAP